jgi:eukaryotic-like serine/threonine-protein kinase
LFPGVDLPWLVANPGGAALPNAVVSHYRLLNQLGSGGMGVVYHAEDTALGRDVALKFLPAQICHDPKRVERLRYEARTASSLNHPNICTIYEVAEDQGELFIAMEYVEGKPLSELLKKRSLPVETILRYAQQIAAGLEHAHERGIIHRDLKPVNVVVTPAGDAKILDFGLAKRTDAEQLPRKTTEGIPTDSSIGLTGTLPYMSPEQLEGGAAGPRSDIWAFGVMLYEMATGERPFHGENLYRLCSAILQEPVPALPDHIPSGLAAVIRRCLEKEPARRYQRASELRAALQALQPSIAVAQGSASPFKSHRKLTVWAGVVAALLLAGVWIGFAWRNANRPNASLKAALEPMQLAVLPPSGGVQPEEMAFDNGLVETLTSRLTELTSKHSLAVVPASEVRARKVVTVDQAHAEFGVNLGLLINVQHAAGQKRVTFSLVDARSHRQLRGGTITAPTENPFILQDRVSENVAQALELQLGPQEKNAFQAHGTNEPAAYDFYLQGRGYLQDYVKLENVENAIQVFDHALKKDPGFAAANAGLGEAYWRKYQLTHEKAWADAAAENCRKAAERDARLAGAHICLGRLFAGEGSSEKALAEYRRGMDLEPTNDAGYAGLAGVYEQLNRLDEAEQTFKQAIAVRPNYWATYNWLGIFYRRHGRYEEAASMYSQVVSLAPDSFTGYYNLGVVRIMQGRYAEAIPVLQRSLEIRKTANGTSNLGTAYFQLHRYADAVAAYEQSTQLDPRNYVIWGNLGDAYYWAPGKRAQAGAAYEKAIALGEEKLRVNPRDADVLSSLAMYYAMEGERKPALEKLDVALRLSPKSPDLLFNAGIVYQQLGDTPRALDALEKAIAAGRSPSALRDTPNFDGLRANPRFLRLIQQ